MNPFRPIHEPSLTVHAWERYCQRVRWVTFAEACRILLTPRNRALLAAGIQNIEMGDVVLRCREGRICTVAPARDRRAKTRVDRNRWRRRGEARA